MGWAEQRFPPLGPRPELAQEPRTTTPVAVPFFMITVTFVVTLRSATVLPCGRILVSDVTVTVTGVAPSAGVIVSVVPYWRWIHR